jgi:ribosome-binding protein aMBF1 (putative translation factor)
MAAMETIQVAGKKEVGVGEAALTMAIGIVIERVSQLLAEDKCDLYKLVKGLTDAKTPEDVEAIRVAMLEILDQEPVRARRLDATDLERHPEKLQRWADFVSQRIRDSRKAKGLTQEQLAEQSGLPQSHISRLERGEHSPSRSTLEKIAKGLNVPLSNLDPAAE